MIKRNIYVLIHSPLVGPLTWSLVAERMREHDIEVILPMLQDSPHSREPFWKQHAESVSQALAHLPEGDSVTLVAHSGAGPLLPAIGQSLPNPINAYVFVDAGIPRDDASRLDLMKWEDPEWAAQLEEELERGEHFPNWSSNDLQDIIPDEPLRRQMVAELQPRELSFFSEPIPVFEGWPDAPCVYIKCSASYEKPAEQAREQGWITEEIKAGHFHMLVEPHVVADKIIELVNEAVRR